MDVIAVPGVFRTTFAELMRVMGGPEKAVIGAYAVSVPEGIEHLELTLPPPSSNHRFIVDRIDAVRKVALARWVTVDTFCEQFPQHAASTR